MIETCLHCLPDFRSSTLRAFSFLVEPHSSLEESSVLVPSLDSAVESEFLPLKMATSIFLQRLLAPLAGSGLSRLENVEVSEFLLDEAQISVLTDRLIVERCPYSDGYQSPIDKIFAEELDESALDESWY
jgi:hypothetical protein